MPFDKTNIFERWETPCSGLLSLYFVGLVDAGEQLTFTVRDEEFQYQFSFESFGPYQVADEAFLEAQQVDRKKHAALAASTGGFPGRTCLVSNSPWAKSFNQTLLGLYFPNGLQHYFIQTSEASLDILAATPPLITVSKTSDIK